MRAARCDRLKERNAANAANQEKRNRQNVIVARIRFDQTWWSADQLAP